MHVVDVLSATLARTIMYRRREKKIHNQSSRQTCVFLRPETALESKVPHGEIRLSRCSSEPLLERKPRYNPESEVI